MGPFRGSGVPKFVNLGLRIARGKYVCMYVCHSHMIRLTRVSLTMRPYNEQLYQSLSSGQNLEIDVTHSIFGFRKFQNFLKVAFN